MNQLLSVVILGAVFVGGGAAGIMWHAGQDAIAAQKADEVRKTDALKQIRTADKAAADHTKALARLNNQLGNAREEIAKLSDRECLDAGTVGVLNAIGVQPGATAASKPAGAPGTTAADTGIRFATERDTAIAIAICRARYSEASDQLNQILDIEEARQPSEKKP